MHKLGIVVPYRDRTRQLDRFLEYMKEYLASQDVEYEIIISEQDDKGSFNRGALLNAGFQEAVELGCDYVVFHDVDLLPKKVDYSYSDVPLELVGKITDILRSDFEIKVTTLTDDYFGGVTLFPVKVFQEINGYSNRYVGWGFEDNDLLYRCRRAQIPLGEMKYRQFETAGPALTFDGKYSYVRVPFLKSMVRKGMSFLVNFRVEDLNLDPELPHDECAIFCIPGLDAALCYESFGTYKFEVFDNFEDVYSIHSKKLPTGMSIQAVVTLDGERNQLKFYLNGKLIGHREWAKDRYLKFGSDNIYLGVGHPTREITSNSSQKWFRGQISDFATFSRVLDNLDVKNIYSKGHLGLNRYQPTQWYSAMVLSQDSYNIPNIADNLSRVSLTGDVVDCKVTPFVTPDYFYRLSVPLKRPGIFMEQPHKTNGTVNGYWKSWATRMNQLRFRDVETFGLLSSQDGLSSLDKVLKVKKVLSSARGVTHLKVTFLQQ